MTTFVTWLVQTTMTIALLVPLVALACLALRRRPASKHLLWLILLLKFVAPPILLWPWQPFDLSTLGRTWAGSATERHSEQRLGARETTPLPAVALSQPLVLPALAMDASTAGESSPVATDHIDARSMPLTTASFTSADFESSLVVNGLHRIHAVWMAFAIWLAGSACLLMIQCRRVCRHWRIVQRAAPASGHLEDAVRSVYAAMRVGPVSTRVARGILSPFVWCAPRPRLVWPERLASPEALARCRGIIAHELAHIRRHDHWVAWIEMVAALVWWWNPLFWLVRRQLRESAELACDAAALDATPQSRREYAQVFLELSALSHRAAPVPVLGVSTGARRSFERRLAMILSEQVSNRCSSRGAVAAGLLAMIALPAWSLDAGDKPAKTPLGGKPVKTPVGELPAKTPVGEKPVKTPVDKPVKTPVGDKSNPAITGGQKPGVKSSEFSFNLKGPADADSGKKTGATSEVELLKALLKSLLPKSHMEEGYELNAKSCLKCHESGHSGKEGWHVKTHPLNEWQVSQEKDASLQKMKLALEEMQQKVNQLHKASAVSESQYQALQLAIEQEKADLLTQAEGAKSRSPAPTEKLSSLDGAPTKQSDTLGPHVASSGTIDLVGLGTAYIDAIGELKLAQSRLSEMSRVNQRGQIVSDSEVEASKIKYDTAQQKLDLLTSVVEGAYESAQADLAHIEQMFKKGYVSESRIASARAQLRIVESILKKRPPTEQSGKHPPLKEGGEIKK